MFFSYSSADGSFAKRLAIDLRARGFTIWLDRHDVQIGDPLLTVLEDGIVKSNSLILILSPTSVSSPWVKEEINLASKHEIPVLPILYRQCSIPRPLDQIVFADFSIEASYGHSLDRLVTRIRGEDRIDEETHQKLDQIPMLKQCRLAMKTAKYTGRFREFLLRELRAISSNPPDSWRPEIAIGYLWFVKELQETGRITNHVWPFLCTIVDDDQLSVHLRAATLGRLLSSGLQQLKNGELEPPIGISCLEQLRENIIVNEVILPGVRQFMDGKYSPSVRGAIETFCNLLLCLSETSRSYLLDWIREQADFISADNALLSSLFSELENQVSFSNSDYDLIEIALFEVCESLQQQNHANQLIGGAMDQNRQTLQVVLKKEQAFNDVSDLIEVFRLASLQEEKLDYGLYVEATGLIEPTAYEIVKGLQGEEFSLSLYTSIVADPRIEVVMSVLALDCLVQKEGPEALLLDDRFPEAFYAPKTVGRDRASIISGLCSAMGEGDFTSVNTLLAIYMSLQSTVEKEKFSATLLKEGDNPKANMIAAFARGEIPYEELVNRLKAI